MNSLGASGGQLSDGEIRSLIVLVSCWWENFCFQLN